MCTDQWFDIVAQAFMEKDSFVEWSYNPPAPSSAHPQRNRTQFPSTHHLGQSDHESDIDLNEVDQEPEANLQDPDATQEDEATTSKFEVSLTSLLECLNVFGTASSNKSHTRSSPEPGQPDSHRYDDDLAERRRARLKDEKSKLKKQACSAIRVTYDGEGCPLVLLYVKLIMLVTRVSLSLCYSFTLVASSWVLYRIEDSGVVTRCELVTYEAGELAEMDFPADRRVVHLILKVKSPFESHHSSKKVLDTNFHHFYWPSSPEWLAQIRICSLWWQDSLWNYLHLFTTLYLEC